MGEKNISKPLLLTIVLIGIALITMVIIYLFAWRPTDEDFQKALGNVSTLDTVVHNMPAVLNDLSQPASITPELVSHFIEGVNRYELALSSLEKSPATQRGSASNTFNSYRSELALYGQSLSSLASSLQLYSDIQTACDKMIADLKEVGSKTEFDKVSADCDKAISSGQTSPSAVFNEKFFNNYQEKAKELVSTAGQVFTVMDRGNRNEIAAAQAALTIANKGIKNAVSVTVDYTFTGPSADTFTKLTTALNDSKNSLVR